MIIITWVSEGFPSTCFPVIIITGACSDKYHRVDFRDKYHGDISGDNVFKSFFLRSPNNFLISYIKPIPKAADMNATLAKSYRPISVSHTLTILLERTFMIGKYFITKSPYNFYGYIKGRSCDIAVDTLKRIVAAEKANIRSVVLVTLDASGAFEGVDWDKIFPRLVKGNNPKIIRCIWLLYRYNRYEVRWKTQRPSILFCNTKVIE